MDHLLHSILLRLSPPEVLAQDALFEKTRFHVRFAPVDQLPVGVP